MTLSNSPIDNPKLFLENGLRLNYSLLNEGDIISIENENNEEEKEISITRLNATCPKCYEDNHYELKGLFTRLEKKQVVNPLLTCRFCNEVFWITVSNKKT